MFCKDLLKTAVALATAVFSSSVTALAGAPLTIPEEFQNYKEIKPEFSTNGPTLLFSDSPEMVYHNGILYRDQVEGEVRLFFHHVNAVDGKKKLAVLLKNDKHLKPVNFEVTRQGIAGKTYDWLSDGKNAEKHYFGKQGNNPKGVLGFGEARELISGYGAVLKTNQLLTGIVDIKLDGPAQLSVMMCDPKADIELFNENASIQPMDEHPLRGTFPKADWHYRLKHPVKLGPEEHLMVKLASDEEGFIKGKDATTGLPAEDYGNYGVIYNVDFSVEGNRKVQFIMNPIGGPFAGYGILENKTTGKKVLLPLPEKSLYFGSTIEEAMELAVLEKGDYRFIWSPPGSGNLPIRLFWRGIPNEKDIKKAELRKQRALEEEEEENE